MQGLPKLTMYCQLN